MCRKWKDVRRRLVKEDLLRSSRMAGAEKALKPIKISPKWPYV